MKNAEVLNMLRYIYNNIIIVIHINILELLSVGFAHPSAPQLAILAFFQHALEHIRIAKAYKLLNLTFLNKNLLLKYFSS